MKASRRLWPALWLLCAAFALWAAGSCVLRLAPVLAGVDFYAYVTFARDLLSPQGASEARFAYFPGVYVFWQLALRLFGNELGALRLAYLGLLLLNALVCARLVSRGLGPVWASLCAFVLAACACLLLDAPLEGFIGATEPIATLPVLLGLWAWAGAPLRGREGLVRGALLGVGLGAGVFVKQQAVLVALGWLALLPDLRGKDARHSWAGVLVVPAAAVATTLACLFGTGGLSALVRGLSTARTYGVGSTQGTSQAAIALALPAAVGLAVFGVALVRRKLPAAEASLAGFALSGGLAAIAQLAVRPYKHYALLAVPLVVVAVGVAAASAIGAAPAPGAIASGATGTGRRERVWFPLGVLGVLAGLFGLAASDDELGRPEWPEGTRAQVELKEVGAWMKPGMPLLVLPPRRAAAHFVLGTRADPWPLGYFWGAHDPGMARKAVEEARDVLVLRPVDEGDVAAASDLGCAEAVGALGGMGFVRVYEGKEMELWRR